VGEDANLNNISILFKRSVRYITILSTAKFQLFNVGNRITMCIK